jgi:PadR family transcriptional regulator PadR
MVPELTEQQSLSSLRRFATREGTLYPLFGKLRRDGLLDYAWHESESGPPRKYYWLTPVGEERLEQLRAEWRALGATLEVLGANE